VSAPRLPIWVLKQASDKLPMSSTTARIDGATPLQFPLLLPLMTPRSWDRHYALRFRNEYLRLPLPRTNAPSRSRWPRIHLGEIRPWELLMRRWCTRSPGSESTSFGATWSRLSGAVKPDGFGLLRIVKKNSKYAVLHASRSISPTANSCVVGRRAAQVDALRISGSRRSARSIAIDDRV